MADQSILDTTHLARMCMSDKEFMRELLVVMAVESRQLLTRLSTAAAAGDHDGAMRAAHTLRGAWANVGAKAGSEAMARAEEAAGAMCGPDELARWSDSAERAFRAIQREIDTLKLSVDPA